MQVFLGVEHIVIKMDATVEKYAQFLHFIEENFSVKNTKEHIYFIPQERQNNHKRKFLMKWLYSYYKKDAKNFNPELKIELLKRIDKPIHIHFLPKEKELLNISATFYEDGICQFELSEKNEKCTHYILQYFSGAIRLKSLTFNLYEIDVKSTKIQEKLQYFLDLKELDRYPVQMIYNKKAFALFLEMLTPLQSEEEDLSKLDRACSLLSVQKTDSLKSIKKIYKKLAKTYHPDLSNLEEDVSTEKFQTLCDAFDIIKKYKTAA